MSMTQWVSTLVLPVSEERDHVVGPSDAPVTLVEYGDFECPFCGAAHPIVKAVIAAMGQDLRFAFRHFPLTTVHPHAEAAAEAAEAAGAQGRFWEMHDLLFENQDRLDAAHIVLFAESLGLDIERFERELAAGVYQPRVHEDFMSGVRSGVNGTPTFYVNGIRYDGSWDLPALLATLQGEAAIARSA
jgi:protein-disulfide isomerase